jgi:uncharacterized phage infection (PIP) family protein YhgE
METVSDLLFVLVVTVTGICVGFGVFLWNHTRGNKKEQLSKKFS